MQLLYTFKTNLTDTLRQEIIGICKSGMKYYAFKPLKKERFSFTKVLANMGAGRVPTLPYFPSHAGFISNNNILLGGDYY